MKQAGEGDRQENAQKMDLKTDPRLPGRGAALPCLSGVKPKVKRSPGCGSQDAQRGAGRGSMTFPSSCLVRVATASRPSFATTLSTFGVCWRPLMLASDHFCLGKIMRISISRAGTKELFVRRCRIRKS